MAFVGVDYILRATGLAYIWPKYYWWPQNAK